MKLTKHTVFLPRKLTSFNVIRGKGVCKEYAVLLANYLSTCDKKPSPLVCKVFTESYNYKPKIKMNIKKSFLDESLQILFKRSSNKWRDHVVTLIDEGDKLFAYNPTMIYGLNFTD